MALLSCELLRLFAKGFLTGTQVQTLAYAAWQDGWGHLEPLAHMLAKPSQTNLKNVALDVITAARKHGITCTTAEVYHVDLPGNQGTLGILLPHEVLPNMLAQDGKATWCLNQESLADAAGLGPLLRKWVAHDDVDFSGDVSEVSILGLHCDGVAYTSSVRAGGSKSILVASWNIISAESDRRRNRRQPMFVVRKQRMCRCGCGGYHTLQALFDVLAWSLRCLLDGVSPTCRHDSTPWSPHDLKNRMASGTALPPAALLQIRGDWEWMTQCFRTRSYGADCFCWMCNATQSPGALCFHDFSPTARHRETLISHQAYLEACAREGEQPSNVFKCPGVLLEHLCVDSMHAGDLGTFQDALGGLFWVEISNKRWHRNVRTGLVRLNQDVKNYYTANKEMNLSSIYPMVLSQIKLEGHYPTLKSKAAQ